MPSRRQDSNIEDLAAIAQLYQSLNGGQQRAQDSHQQNALGILGLMMQQQGQEDNLDFKKSAAEAENNRFLASQTQSAADSGIKNYWEQQKFEQDKAAQANALSRTTLSGLGSMPGMTGEAYMQAASDLGVPGADAMVTRGKQAITNNSVSQLQSMLGPIYSQFTDKPANAQKALDMIWQSDPRMKSADVQAALAPYLQAQNEGLVQSHAAVAPPTTPEAVATRRTGENVGGLFGRGGILDMHDQTPPDVVAQRNAYREAHPEFAPDQMPGPFSWLFGTSPQKQSNEDALTAAGILARKQLKKK